MSAWGMAELGHERPPLLARLSGGYQFGKKTSPCVLHSGREAPLPDIRATGSHQSGFDPGVTFRAAPETRLAEKQ